MALQRMTGEDQHRTDGSDGLRVHGLETVYGSVLALRGVSIRIAPGEFVAVLGANGAGKTTLVRAITGLLSLHRGKARSGTINLDGESLLGQSRPNIVKRGIAQVPEGRMLFPNLTVEENLRCGAATRPTVEIGEGLERIWEVFPLLAALRRQQAGLLSGGEQQMVAVGRALMARPTLLVCDELSLGLAPKVVRQLFDLLTEINEREGVSILAIEQNARLALKHSKHAYVVEIGRVVLEGSSAELRDDPHVQELYLGGGGEATEVYEAAKKSRRSDRGL